MDRLVVRTFYGNIFILKHNNLVKGKGSSQSKKRKKKFEISH